MIFCFKYFAVLLWHYRTIYYFCTRPLDSASRSKPPPPPQFLLYFFNSWESWEYIYIEYQNTLPDTTSITIHTNRGDLLRLGSSGAARGGRHTVCLYIYVALQCARVIQTLTLAG